MSIKSLPFFVVLFFLNLNTFAQTWQQTQMHGGGYVTGIIPHPTDENIVFARIDVAGMYKTSNGGETWESLTKNIIKDNNYNYYVRSFAIDPTDTDKLYFLSGNAPYDHGGITNEWFLWTSMDGGVNWTRIVAPTAVGGNGMHRHAGESLLIDQNNPNLLYIAGQSTFNYGTSDWNTNGGLHTYNLQTNTWSVPSGINGIFDKAWITSLKFEPNNSDVLYISAANSMLNGVATTNSGLWKYVISTETLTQLRADEVFDFDFDAGNPSTILTTQNAGLDKSTDGGQTWAGLTQPFGYTYNYCVTAHPTESGHWFFGYWNGIFQSGLIETNDAGANYHAVKYNPAHNADHITFPPYVDDNQTPGFANAISTLMFHPANIEHAYIGDWDGIFKTINATGLLVDPIADITSNSNWDWTWTTQGIYNVVQVRVSKHPTQANTFYNCLADVGYYSSSDAGATMEFDTQHPITSIYGVQFAPSNPMIGYCIGDHYTGKGRLVKTTDGGQSWLEPASNQQYTEGFFETNFSACVTDLQISDSNPDVIIVGIEKGGMSNQVYCSDDGGVSFYAWDDGLPNNIFKTWTAQDKLLKDADGETFYTWHQNFLYARHLDDATWTAAVNPSASGTSWFAHVITDPNQAGKIYATQFSNVIYQSIDHGQTWTTINSGTTRSTQIAISEGGRLAVLQGHNANAQAVQNVFVSYDTGTSWEEIGMEGFYTMFSSITFIGEETLLGWTQHTGSATFSLAPALSSSWMNVQQNCDGEKVILSWQMEGYQQANTIEIEQAAFSNSVEHLNWKKVGQVEMDHSSSFHKTYQWTDENNRQSESYYRLKMTQKDGQIEYSQVLLTDCTDVNAALTVYPNPVSKVLEVALLDANLIGAQVQVYNLMGQSFDINIASRTDSHCQIRTEHLQNGVYYLVVKKGRAYWRKMFVVE